MNISIVIPTFRRPDGLRRALESAIAQSRQPDEIVVVDNDPDGSARTMVATAKAIAKCDVVYVHEPRPGVSNARNAGFGAARGRFIAFLDDDEIANVYWLAALMETARALDADVVFGPLRGEALDVGGIRGDLARRLYSRIGPEADTVLDKPYGCGNSLIDRAAFDLPAAPFDPRMNASGGEDDVFFAILARQGARFAWSVKAHGVETVGASRTSWSYLAARAFAFGQGATQSARHAGSWSGIAFWMAVGLAQFLVYGPLAALAAIASPGRAAGLIDRCIQGAGKLLWIQAFEPRFYGQNVAAPS
jgi:succinoglycan biosynthesis protein ExoM